MWTILFLPSWLPSISLPVRVCVSIAFALGLHVMILSVVVNCFALVYRISVPFKNSLSCLFSSLSFSLSLFLPFSLLLSLSSARHGPLLLLCGLLFSFVSSTMTFLLLPLYHIQHILQSIQIDNKREKKKNHSDRTARAMAVMLLNCYCNEHFSHPFAHCR